MSFFLSASTCYRRLASGGRNREGGLPNPVCPGQRAASVQVPVPVCASSVPLLYPTKPARLSIVGRSVKSKSDQPSPSTKASDSNRQHHKVGPPASSLPLRPPPSLPYRPPPQASWRRTRKRRTARCPTHRTKVSSKRRKVTEQSGHPMPLCPLAPGFYGCPFAIGPPHHLASNKPSSPDLCHLVWPFQPRPGPDPS